MDLPGERQPRSGLFALVCLFTWFLAGTASADCSPYPIGAPIGNVTLSNGNTARGVAYSVGTPKQNLAFLPHWPLNNIILYGADGKCTNPAPEDDNGCTTWRGGNYDSLASNTRKPANSDSYPEDEGHVPAMNFITDQLKLSDNVTISAQPMGMALEDWGQEGYFPMMAFGLGKNSSILNSLVEDGSIVSRTWSMFHGWMGGTKSSQANGTFIFGGYDRAKVSGKGYKMDMSKNAKCSSRLLVEIDDLVLNFPNGSTYSLISSEDKSIPACIVPDFPVLMTLPTDPYFDTFQTVTETVYSGRTAGLAYYSVVYGEKDPVFGGDITIQLKSGPSIRVPNHQLVVPEMKIDEDSGAWYMNYSSPNLVINPLQDVNKGDMVQLGRQFLSSAYVMVNHDAEEFTLWSSNPTDSVDMVAVDKKGEETVDFCSAATTDSSEPTGSPRPTEDASSSPENEDKEGDTGLSTGAIAGIAVGGVAAVALIGAIAFLIYRRRRVNSSDQATGGSVIPQSNVGEPVFSENPYRNQGFGPVELMGPEHSRHELAG